MNNKAKGIILRAHSYSEADLVIKVLLSTGQVESFLAKGAKKSKKRFSGGVLEPLSYTELTYISKSTSTLNYLSEASIINGFEGIRSDYDRLNMAFDLVKTIDKFGNIASEVGQETFNLLGNAFKTLSGDCSLSLFKLVFLSKLLHIQGVLPDDWSKSNLVTYPISQHQEIKLENDVIYRLSRKVDFYLQELF